MGKLPCKWWSFHSLAISGTDLLEVPTIYKAYLSWLCKGISPQNTALYGTVPPFQDPEIPIEVGMIINSGFSWDLMGYHWGLSWDENMGYLL